MSLVLCCQSAALVIFHLSFYQVFHIVFCPSLFLVSFGFIQSLLRTISSLCFRRDVETGFEGFCVVFQPFYFISKHSMKGVSNLNSYSFLRVHVLSSQHVSKIPLHYRSEGIKNSLCKAFEVLCKIFREIPSSSGFSFLENRGNLWKLVSWGVIGVRWKSIWILTYRRPCRA